MKLETNLEYPLETKSLDEEGHFEGYLSVWNDEDRQQDIVDKGAWVIALDPLPLFYRHNRDEPLGAITEYKEDDYGLYVSGNFDLSVKRAQEIHSLAKKGIMKLSPGYLTKEDYFDGLIRHIKSGEIYEGTITPFPANLNAGFTSVKEDGEDLEVKEVHGGGLPLAGKGISWDEGAARAALNTWSGGDINKYKRAFLYYDGSGNTSGCKFPIATVINGTLTAVPAAVHAAESRLNQAKGIPAAELSRMASILKAYSSKLGWNSGAKENTAVLEAEQELILKTKELREALTTLKDT